MRTVPPQKKCNFLRRFSIKKQLFRSLFTVKSRLPPPALYIKAGSGSFYPLPAMLEIEQPLNVENRKHHRKREYDN